MKKRLVGSVCLALLLSGSALAHAGAVQEGASSTFESVGKDLEPVGEDINYLGKNLVYGIGAIAVAPLRFVQDVFNGLSQGVAKEKLVDHTN